MTIELVVFDVAGTTVEDDDAVARSLCDAVRSSGGSATREDAVRVMGLPKPIALEAMLSGGRPHGASPDEVERAFQDFVERMVHHYRTAPEVSAIEGAEDTFRALQRLGVRVALDTGFSRRILDAILARLQWDQGGLLDVTVASDEVVRGRPYPDLIHRAMELTSVADPRRVVKVGDTVADVREGLAAGCGLVVGVTSGTGSEAELRAEGASLVLPSVAALPGVLADRARRDAAAA